MVGNVIFISLWLLLPNILHTGTSCLKEVRNSETMKPIIAAAVICPIPTAIHPSQCYAFTLLIAKWFPVGT